MNPLVPLCASLAVLGFCAVLFFAQDVRPAVGIPKLDLLSQDRLRVEANSDPSAYDEDLSLVDGDADGFRAIQNKWPNAFDRFKVVSSTADALSFADLQTKTKLSDSTSVAKAKATSKLTDQADDSDEEGSDGDGTDSTSGSGSAYDRCEANYPYQTDTDYQGSDLMKGIENVQDSKACCELCVANSECKYFTYGTGGERASTCWIKSSRTGVESQLYRTSGAPVEYTYPPSHTPTQAPTANPMYPESASASPVEPASPPPPLPPTTTHVTKTTSTNVVHHVQKVTYVTHNELKLALKLLAHNLLHYLAIQIQGLNDDKGPQLRSLKKELRAYIDSQVSLILAHQSSGSLHDLKKRFMNDMTKKFKSTVHVHGLTASSTPGMTTTIRELPHAHTVYKDKEALRGLRNSAQYMISGTLQNNGKKDPLGQYKYGAEAMIPTHIIEHKNVASTDHKKCDPLAGWSFNLC